MIHHHQDIEVVGTKIGLQLEKLSEVTKFDGSTDSGCKTGVVDAFEPKPVDKIELQPETSGEFTGFDGSTDSGGETSVVEGFGPKDNGPRTVECRTFDLKANDLARLTT